MAQFTYKITDEIGIHARPAGLLVKLAKAAGTKVTVTKGDKTVEATKLMALMGMGIKCGDEIVVECDNEEALANLQEFFKENL